MHHTETAQTTGGNWSNSMFTEYDSLMYRKRGAYET